VKPPDYAEYNNIDHVHASSINRRFITDYVQTPHNPEFRIKRIVLVNPGVLHRIQSGLLDVVQVTTTTIRWKRIHCQGKATISRGLTAKALALCHHLLAISPTFTANERSPLKVSPVVIDRGWVWQD
jgi:hypothetical protein